MTIGYGWNIPREVIQERQIGTSVLFRQQEYKAILITRMHYRSVPVALLFLTTLLCRAQQAVQQMNNQDVIDMVSIGLSDEVVIDKIHSTPAPNFDTSVAALKSLKASRVSDTVIRAMINPHPQPAASMAIGVSAAKNSSLVPDEVGVYVIQQGKPVEMQPEIVNWQTGGVIKSAVTVGIVKGDRNGKVMNPRSTFQIATPADFIIKTPEGTSATEYQLLRLHEKGNRREFRATTGGVFHQSGGAQPNLALITPEKIGPMTRLRKR